MPILRVSNTSILTGREKSYLAAAPAATDTTFTLQDASQFVSGSHKFVLVGDLGKETAEIKKISSVSGNIITLTAGLAFAHAIDELVTQLDYDQVEFSRATTVAGSKSVLATSNLEADDLFSSYNDLTNTTGYGFARFYNSGSTAFSSYSGAIPYTGFDRSSVRKMKDQALSLTHESISDLISEDFLLDETNNWQDDVARQKDWSWELQSATDSVVSGQKAYSFPTSPNAFKYTDSPKSFKHVHIHNYERLGYIDKSEFEEYLVGTISSTLDGAITGASTSVVLTNSSDFDEAGTALVGDGTDDEFSWTANDTDTNTLSGVTGITVSHSSGATVWQTSSLGKPDFYSVYNDQIFFQPVASTTYHGLVIYYDYYEKTPVLDDDTDTTEIPFFHLAQYYLAWKIESRKGNKDMADYWRQIYENRLSGEMKRDRTGLEARFIPNVPGVYPRS
jgi:hypothetical protein